MDLIKAFKPILVISIENLPPGYSKGAKIEKDVIAKCMEALGEEYVLLFDQEHSNIYISGKIK